MIYFFNTGIFSIRADASKLSTKVRTEITGTAIMGLKLVGVSPIAVNALINRKCIKYIPKVSGDILVIIFKTE